MNENGEFPIDMLVYRSVSKDMFGLKTNLQFELEPLSLDCIGHPYIDEAPPPIGSKNATTYNTSKNFHMLKKGKCLLEVIMSFKNSIRLPEKNEHFSPRRGL